jgi:hypothetical protein
MGEHPFQELEGLPMMARAEVMIPYTGELQGEGRAEFLMLSTAGGSAATFVGLKRVIGKLDGRASSFVLQASGSFAQGRARTDWTVIEGSGCGELEGLGPGEAGPRSGLADRFSAPTNRGCQFKTMRNPRPLREVRA